MASILVVCTGNICRSPLAEGFIRELLERRGGDPRVDVASAGTWGWEGSAAVPESVGVAAEKGVDISEHKGRRMEPSHISESDLIIGLTREHCWSVAEMAPEAASKTFTLKELARLLEGLDPPSSTDVSPEILDSRVALANDLRRSGFEGLPGDEDVIDPLGMPLETFRAVAWEIGEYCKRVVNGLFGSFPIEFQSVEPATTEEAPS